MIVGYARVSSSDQNISSQIERLKDNDCPTVYTHIISGVREDRRGLLKILSYLRKGDTVLIYKTDRIFRSHKNMIDLIELFNKKELLSSSKTTTVSPFFIPIT